MTRYQYRFDTLDGWLPDEQGRSEVDYGMLTVLGDADITWDLGGASEPFIVVEMDLDGRLPLEGLAVAVQAWNTMLVQVAGWPPQMQSCVARPLGGTFAPPVAVATVVATAITPV